jgi:hypothetical protein
MPYIEQNRRKIYDKHIDSILNEFKDPQQVAGEFTYIIYRLLKWFSKKYWIRALGIGCLICAILEIYRKEHVF